MYTTRTCGWTSQHPILNVAVQPHVYETLQNYCYEASGELPTFINIVLSTPSTRDALHVQQHSDVYLVITPKSAPQMSSAALRNSAVFHASETLSGTVTGITPLRDRVGRCTHRAVCRVQL